MAVWYREAEIWRCAKKTKRILASRNGMCLSTRSRPTSIGNRVYNAA